MIDDVFWLEITVDDLIGMHVIQCSADLLDQEASHVFWHFAFLLQEVVELAREAELQSEVDVVFVGEESVHLDYIGVIEETLYLDFPY